MYIKFLTHDISYLAAKLMKLVTWVGVDGSPPEYCAIN